MAPPKVKSSLHKQDELSSPERVRANELEVALRQQYEDVKKERIPDRLQRLIDALREVEHMAREKEQDDL